MLFRKKKSEKLIICAGDLVLYEGVPDEIPIPENVIIEMSIRFFNDPHPCYIHEGAVRMRLCAEILEAVKAKNPDYISLAEKYTGLSNITDISLLP